MPNRGELFLWKVRYIWRAESLRRVGAATLSIMALALETPVHILKISSTLMLKGERHWRPCFSGKHDQEGARAGGL